MPGNPLEGQIAMSALLKGMEPAISQQFRYGGLTEEQKLIAKARGSDVTDIDSFVQKAGMMTADERATGLAAFRAGISKESLPYLEYRLSLMPAPQAEPPWGAGAGAGGRTRMQQLMAGTQAGYPEELAMGQLPEAGRAEEWARRGARGEIEYPGITEAGRGPLSALGIEGVLPTEEATRLRAREGNVWDEVKAVTGKWAPDLLETEREQTVLEAVGSGQMSKLAEAAAMTFVNLDKPPLWARDLAPEQLAPLGLAKDAQGRLINAFPEDNPALAGAQARRQMIMRLPPVAWPDWTRSGYTNDRRAMVVMAAWGEAGLTQAQAQKVLTGEPTALSGLFLKVISRPFISTDPMSPEWYALIDGLSGWLTPAEIRDAISLSQSRTGGQYLGGLPEPSLVGREAGGVGGGGGG